MNRHKYGSIVVGAPGSIAHKETAFLDAFDYWLKEAWMNMDDGFDWNRFKINLIKEMKEQNLL